MDIDWWSLSREARREGWNLAASILSELWNALIGMLWSGDFIQVTLALIIIIGAVSSSSWTLLKIVRRLVNGFAFSI